MKYHIEVTQTAEREAYDIYRFIARHSPDNAARWFESLFEATQALREFPERCGLAPESRRLVEKIRQLLFGNYRILFVIREKTVFVLRIRHAARRRLRRNEIVPPDIE